MSNVLAALILDSIAIAVLAAVSASPVRWVSVGFSVLAVLVLLLWR